MEWDPDFFDMMYLAMCRRKAVEEVTTRRIMSTTSIIGALYANTNLDAEANKGVRERMMEELNQTSQEGFESTVAQIYGAKDPHAIDEIDMNDPWWAAMKLPETVRLEHEALSTTPVVHEDDEEE